MLILTLQRFMKADRLIDLISEFTLSLNYDPKFYDEPFGHAFSPLPHTDRLKLFRSV